MEQHRSEKTGCDLSVLELVSFRELCESAAREAGEVLLGWQGRFTVREKGRADLVTEADLAAQECVKQRVLGRFPRHGFLAEENASIPPGLDGLRWIVDPLDGTTNYVHSFPEFAVSIALECRGKVLVGCVFNPATEECYSAHVGGGAWLNGGRLAVSGVGDLHQAMVGASFPSAIEKGAPEFEQFAEMLVTCQSVRRLGSAAMNLAYVAAGRMDAYWATATKSWDIAAGVLLVSEAGGAVLDVDGRDFNLNRPRVLAAATPGLARAIAGVLRIS